MLCTDTSNTCIGGAIHHRRDKVEPLAFFSRKLSAAECKWSTYDRELLVIYASIKHFRYQLEGRQFAIYTNHKPLRYACASISEKASPRFIRQLDFIAQFSTDISYIPGALNVPADTLSRICGVVNGLDYTALAKAQNKDDELQNLLKSENVSLQLKRVPALGTNTMVYCEIENDRIRPYLPLEFRKLVYDSVHNLSHPGPRVTAKLFTHRFVWPSMQRDCTRWACACLGCQRAKVGRYTRTPVGRFPTAKRFAHIQVDIVGPLPPSNGKDYCVTVIDRTTSWPEAIPTSNITAPAIAEILITHWFSHFGIPAYITSDQGVSSKAIYSTL